MYNTEAAFVKLSYLWSISLKSVGNAAFRKTQYLPAFYDCVVPNRIGRRGVIQDKQVIFQLPLAMGS
jgi:hypothetical protein